MILLNRAMRNYRIVDKLHTESERYGMHINVVKTKKKTEENDAKVNIDGQAIENVKSFLYLGSKFTWDNDCSKDIQRLLQQHQCTASYNLCGKTVG